MELKRNNNPGAQLCSKVLFVESRFVDSIGTTVTLKNGYSFSTVYSTGTVTIQEDIKQKDGNNYYEQKVNIPFFGLSSQDTIDLINRQYIVILTLKNGETRCIGSLENPCLVDIAHQNKGINILFYRNSIDPSKMVTA